MTHQEFNEAVFRLWENHFTDNDDIYVPLILPPVVDKGLLFIGNNPSFSVEGFRRFLRNTHLTYIDPHEFFHWKNRITLDVPVAMQIERFAKDKYPYFNKFRDISKYAGVDWEHIDLFFFRETSQSTFKERIQDKRGVLTNFGRDQIALAKKMVEEIDPCIIVVANAFASQVFKNEFDAKFDEQFGYHAIELNQRSVPVFLGSMLTGQRAMDVYSYQRLKWHIRAVVRQLM